MKTVRVDLPFSVARAISHGCMPLDPEDWGIAVAACEAAVADADAAWAAWEAANAEPGTGTRGWATVRRCAYCGGEDVRWCPAEHEMGYVRVAGTWECNECGCTEMEGVL